MEKKFAFKRIIHVLRKFFFTLMVSGIGLYLYAHEIEPRLLQTKQLSIQHPLIPTSFSGVKIVQFSDTHIGFHYTSRQFSKLIAKINKLHPDLILFTGDLMDEPNKYEKPEQLARLLASLDAPMGKFAVFGNHDHGGYGTDIYQKIMESADFTVLKNEATSLRLRDGSSIRLIGLDDAMLGKPNIQGTIRGQSGNRFTILLSHAPDFANLALKNGIHLQLSGHSHGGQIKLPYFGSFDYTTLF